MSSLHCPLPASACLDFPSPVSRPRLCRKTSGSAAVARFAPCPSGLPVLPLRYALAAFRPDVHIWPSRSVPSVPPCQRTHTWTNPRSFAFPLVEGSTSFLVTVDQCWKSARLRGGVETATPIHPITGRPWLFPAFLCPPPPQHALRR